MRYSEDLPIPVCVVALVVVCIKKIKGRVNKYVLNLINYVHNGKNFIKKFDLLNKLRIFAMHYYEILIFLKFRCKKNENIWHGKPLNNFFVVMFLKNLTDYAMDLG